MYHFIVIGNPISHSKSPVIHTAFARSLGLDISYHRQFCPADKESFKAVVEAFFCGGGTGANITLPFKEWAYELCDTLSSHAKSAKAVNTLAIRDGKLFGDNTDGRGLVADLTTKGVDLTSKNVAIFGAGGATLGAMLPLLQAGANITIFNRTLVKAERLVVEFSPFLQPNQTLCAKILTTQNLTGVYDVIINATSASTTGQSLDLAHTDIICTDTAYDMMYGKSSEFLTHFAGQVQTFDGMGMLINQAKLAFELWTGQIVDLSCIDFETILQNQPREKP